MDRIAWARDPRDDDGIAEWEDDLIRRDAPETRTRIYRPLFEDPTERWAGEQL